MGSTKQLTEKSKNDTIIPSLEVVEAFLVQSNLVENQNQQKSEVLHTFTLNKSYGYLLNVELSNLVFFKIFNTEFDGIS